MSETVKYLKATNKVIPKDWCWVRLGELCEFIRGVTFDKAEISAFPEDGRVPILRAGNIGLCLDTTNDLIWVPNERISTDQLLRVGDAAICMSSGSAEVVGKTAPVEVEWKGSVGAFCGIVRAKDPSTADFVNFWFRSRLFLDWRDDQARGANIQNLRFSQLTKLEIPLPPPPEQRRIAGVLREQMEAVEKARAAAQARLEAVKTLPAAFLREVFPQPGQPLPDGWRSVKLGEVCKFRHGSTPSMANKEYWGGDILWVSPKDMYVDILMESQNKISNLALQETRIAEVPKGTVLIVIRSGVLAHTLPVAIVGKPLTFNQDIKAVMPSQESLLSEYLRWLLLSHESIILDHGIKQGATVHSIRSGFIEGFPIPLPPLVEQRLIAGALNEQMVSIEKARAAADKELNTINALPAALLRQAFNGEI